MKKRFKYFAIAAVALLAMSSCNNETDEQAPAKEKQPVQFQMTMSGSTRTTTDTNADRTTTWNEGDAVGIFVYKHGETVNPIAVNAKYVLTGENWVAEAGSEIYAEEAYDYYAYYPYQTGVTDPALINVSAITDQSTAAGADYGKSDILASQNKTVAANAVNVPLLFKHMFAMVEVKVEGDKVSKQPTKVVLKGVKLDATLNILSDTPTATTKADAEAKDVTMYYLTKTTDANKAPFSFRAVVPAQAIAASTPLVAIYAPDADNKTYTMQHSAEVTYETGKFRQLVVSIGTSKVSLTIPKGDLTINPWGESGKVPGTGDPVLTQLITIPISSLTNEEMTPVTSDGAITTGSEGWYAIIANNTSATTYTVTDETVNGTSTKIIKIVFDNKLSWYQNYLAFHHTNNTNILENKVYELSFWAKADIASNNEKSQLGVYFKLTKEPFVENEKSRTGMFAILDETTEALSANAAWSAKNLSTVWVEYKQKFSLATFVSASGPGTTPIVSKGWDELTDPKTYTVCFAPRTFATTYSIANVKLTEVIK